MKYIVIILLILYIINIYNIYKIENFENEKEDFENEKEIENIVNNIVNKKIELITKMIQNKDSQFIGPPGPKGEQGIPGAKYIASGFLVNGEGSYKMINESFDNDVVEELNLKKSFKKLGSSIKKTAEKAGSSIKKTAQKAGSSIKKTAQKAGGAIKNTVQKSGSSMMGINASKLPIKNNYFNPNYTVTRTYGTSPLTNYAYLDEPNIFGSFQQWILTDDNKLKNRYDDNCLTVNTNISDKVYVDKCDITKQQQWRWDKNNRLLLMNDNNKCLGLSKPDNNIVTNDNKKGKRFLILKKCDKNKINKDEIWNFI